MKKARVLVVDDHPVVRKGIGAILQDRPDWEVCGEASNGREAVAAAAQLKPDVVVMDISMPELNGLDATRQILSENPEMQVLILSMHESEQIVRDVLQSGARGYLLKADAGNELMAAMEAMRRRKLFFTHAVTEVVTRGYLTGRPITAHAGPAAQLSRREREIVQLLAEGRTNKEVAATLGISVKTVETHRARIMDKLDIHSVTGLVRYAIRNKLIEC
jgi:DNA-binding NarL/FixJ family response regulator